MSQSSEYLFVYGTLLRQSQSPVSSMLSKNSSFVEKGTVRGRLFDIGEYPGIVVNEDSKKEVMGEVFKLKNPTSLLKKLDSYEGKEYKRIKTHVYLDNGEHLSAWIYNFTQPTDDYIRIKSGDYMSYLGLILSLKVFHAGRTTWNFKYNLT